MQNEFLVHTREGRALPVLRRARSSRIVVGGRSTYFCPSCQVNGCAESAVRAAGQRSRGWPERP